MAFSAPRTRTYSTQLTPMLTPQTTFNQEVNHDLLETSVARARTPSHNGDGNSQGKLVVPPPKAMSDDGEDLEEMMSSPGQFNVAVRARAMWHPPFFVLAICRCRVHIRSPCVCLRAPEEPECVCVCVCAGCRQSAGDL